MYSNPITTPGRPNLESTPFLENPTPVEDSVIKAIDLMSADNPPTAASALETIDTNVPTSQGSVDAALDDLATDMITQIEGATAA